MSQDTSPDADVVLERFDAITSEAMVQLHRWRSERDERDAECGKWRRQCAELQRALEEGASVRADAMIPPLKDRLRAAIGRIDRILAHAEQVDA